MQRLNFAGFDLDSWLNGRTQFRGLSKWCLMLEDSSLSGQFTGNFLRKQKSSIFGNKGFLVGTDL